MRRRSMMKKVCKFDITDLLPIGLTFVVLGIGLSYGLNVMGDVKSDMTVNSAEYNASENAILGVAKLPEKLPLKYQAHHPKRRSLCSSHPARP